MQTGSNPGSRLRTRTVTEENARGGQRVEGGSDKPTEAVRPLDPVVAATGPRRLGLTADIRTATAYSLGQRL